MPHTFSVPISEVVDYLGLERNPKQKRRGDSFDVKCPFCNDKGYHMNINVAKNAYALSKRLGFSDVMFIALQGVNSTRELPEIARTLKDKGVTVVHDGFDMDKLVNPAVFKAMKAAQRILRENGGLLLKPLLWDRDYADLKFRLLDRLCIESGIKVKKTGNVYSDLVVLSSQLAGHHIDYNFVEIDGKKRIEKWNEATKGIDDYFGSVLSRS